jgi:DNA-binding XRE family transcriptional regulator
MVKRRDMKWAKSLKNLRGILAKNQPQFAELVGVSADLIKSVESGRAPVTRKLGAKIQLATGATIGESKVTAQGFGPYQPLKGNAAISAWTRKGGALFTLAAFEEHRATYPPNRVDDMVNTLAMLFKAASGPEKWVRVKGKPDQVRWPFSKVAGLRWSFMEWAQEAVERFNLPVPSPLVSALPVKPLPDASKSSRAPRPRRASR